MFFVLSVKFSSFVLPLFPFPFLHSFLSFLCFFHFSLSLSLSFFRLSILCVFISFLLPSLLPYFLPSFLHSPLLPFFLPSFLLSSTDSFLSSFLSFFFFLSCFFFGVPYFQTNGCRWCTWDIFAIYLLGDIDVSNYFYLDEERRRTQHISHLSEFFSNFGFFIISQIWFAMMGIFIIHYDPPKKHGPVFHKLPLCLVVSAFMLRTVELCWPNGVAPCCENLPMFWTAIVGSTDAIFDTLLLLWNPYGILLTSHFWCSNAPLPMVTHKGKSSRSTREPTARWRQDA